VVAPPADKIELLPLQMVDGEDETVTVGVVHCAITETDASKCNAAQTTTPRRVDVKRVGVEAVSGGVKIRIRGGFSFTRNDLESFENRRFLVHRYETITIMFYR
jgi:hypothetical protein